MDSGNWPAGYDARKEEFFTDFAPETLPPLDGPVTLKDGTVIKPKSHLRGQVLRDAQKVINGDRQDAYGNPENSFQRIADLWDAYLSGKYDSEIDLTAQDVALMMTLMKIARTMTGSGHMDSYVDACGYMALAADMEVEG
jgi:hypothetical protein